MSEALEWYANPSASYSISKAIKERILEAKYWVSKLINCEPDNIIFTSGGSESNNFILKGFFEKFQFPEKHHVITSSFEHPAILEVVKQLSLKYGTQVTCLPVSSYGFVSVESLKEAIRPNTSLITIMSVNNEIGSIQPIKELAQVARAHNIFFHTDAVQAIGKIPVDVKETGVDALSISGHKFNGPKGIGAVYIKDHTKISSLISGGGQEKGLRSGTENTIGILGLGAAAKRTFENQEQIRSHYQRLKLLFLRELQKNIPEAIVNCGFDSMKYANNTASIRFEDIRAELLAAVLNEKYHIAVSLGSACSSNKKAKLSHVLQSVGMNDTQIRGTLRISFGIDTQEQDIYYLVQALKETVEIYSKMYVEAH